VVQHPASPGWPALHSAVRTACWLAAPAADAGAISDAVSGPVLVVVTVSQAAPRYLGRLCPQGVGGSTHAMQGVTRALQGHGPLAPTEKPLTEFVLWAVLFCLRYPQDGNFEPLNLLGGSPAVSITTTFTLHCCL